MKLLIVEDDKRMASLMQRSLEQAGYVVECAYDGEEGLARACAGDFEGIILDLLLPKRDGLSVVKTLRQQGRHTPVLVVTARGSAQDRATGLDSGCDDYLVKPFAEVELVARVRSLLQRGTPQTAQLRVGELTLDCTARRASRAGRVIELTPKEFALLEYLMRNVGQLITRTMIEQQVWHFDFDSGTKLVEVHVGHLRDKVDKGFEAPLIHTVPGVGYVLRQKPLSRTSLGQSARFGSF